MGKSNKNNKKEKALIVASVASMIDLFNRENIKILQNLGYEVHVACNFEEGSITSQDKVNEFRRELNDLQVKSYHVPIPRSITQIKNIVVSRKELKKIIETNSYKLMHCHSPIGGVVARSAGKKAHRKGMKIIYTAHGFHFFKGAPIKNWFLFFPIEKYYSYFTDILLTMNQEDFLIAKRTMKAQKVAYIPGIGIDLKKIKNEKKLSRNIRSELQLSDKDFVLISVGQISKRKNQEIIIRTLAELDNKKIKYLIVGFGELKKNLEKLAKDLRVEDQVSFLGYRENIIELLSNSDCFIFPSLQEGLPVAAMEAMAVGIPIVASNIRGNSDLLNKNSDFLVNNTINDYKMAINKIYESEALREHLKSNNMEQIKEFSVSKVNSKMCSIYKDVN